MEPKLHNYLLFELSKKIKAALDTDYPNHNLEIADIYSQISEPPNTKMGDLAFPCFPLAKVCRTSPNNIASALEKSINTDELIEKSLAAGPYLNFFIKTECIGKNVIINVLNESFFKQKFIQKPEKIMVEYSQPNTHKELHVGHMRNLCLGNATVRLLKYSGHNVVAATYPGDVGTHVAKCLWYLKYINKKPVPKEDKGAWLGEMYSLANNFLEDAKGSDKEEEYKKQLATILKEIESQKGEFYDLWKETREWSLELFHKTYKWVNVDFDEWYFESVVDSASLKRANQYHKDGLYIKSEGAIGMDLSEDKLGFCMMIKSDGNGMYATKDIELAHQKFEKHKLDKSLYIVDKRQAFHFKQVFKVLEKIGFEHAKDCFHLQYDFVELPDGAMSSRKGNIIPLMKLIQEMETTIKKEYLERYKDEWSKEEIDNTATMVANGAIKYGMIRMDNNRKIVFDMKEWLKLDGETGPYLQYVHARISSLCRKLDYNPKQIVDWSLLTHETEKGLILKLSNFNTIAQQAANQYKTSLLCSYLFELGKMFNSFYAECPIMRAESEELKNSRLALAKAVSLVMQKGLELIGIDAPLKM